MRPTPNLPNSTILSPILSKLNKTNLNSASLYSYGNFLLNLIKSNEKKSDLEEKPNETVKITQTIKLKNENLSYIYSIADSFKNISNFGLIYEKYLNNVNTMAKKNENNVQSAINIVNKIEIKQKKITPIETLTLRKAMEEKLLKLCDSIENSSNSSNLVKYTIVNDLFQALYERYDNPDIHLIISKKQKSLIKNMLMLRTIAAINQDNKLTGRINECLALIGYVDQTAIKNRGINILSLDGGGAKGLVTIEVLKQIQKKCGGKPIHEIFDYICGVSTGAILASLLGVFKLSLEECEQYYRGLSRDVFDRNMAAGLSNLIRTYSYYDTQQWEKTLKNLTGETLMINSAKEQNACKIGIVSNVTTPNHMKIFLFRNYHLPSFSQSHYDGTCKFKVWEAVRASSAAPGYYEDFKLDGYVFHDGGILANNPTAIGIHEAKLLWPKTEINCVVSVGNGRYKPVGYASSKALSVSLKQKINGIVAGISSTESIHTMLCDLLPNKVYYRFNPYMAEEFHLDEIRQEKWEIMKANTKMYMRRNDFKFKMVANQLLRPKTITKKMEHFLYQNFKCGI